MKRALLIGSLVLTVYFLGFVVAIMGYINGWGLEVKSWWWLIGTYVVNIVLMGVGGQLLINFMSVDVEELDDE